MTTHSSFEGRKVKIPNPRPGWINPFAGKLGDVRYAGWDDQYCIYVDGQYLVRASAAEIEPNLVPRNLTVEAMRDSTPPNPESR